MARNLKALVTKHSFKERYKTAQTYLQKLKFLVEDVSRSSYRVFLIQLDSQRASEVIGCSLCSWCLFLKKFRRFSLCHYIHTSTGPHPNFYAVSKNRTILPGLLFYTLNSMLLSHRVKFNFPVYVCSL